MQLIFTEQAIQSLNEALDFLSPNVSREKINKIRDNILARAHMLLTAPYLGQRELYLEHLEPEHRRIIEGYYKIIYTIEGDKIYITDIFDSRQDPEKMK